MLEVIVTSVDDAIRAERGGADRLELVTGMSEGGLTPSYGLIQHVIESVSIPVCVMIRPHSRSFCYSDEDVRVMIIDIRAARELGAGGLVIGPLNQVEEIDTDILSRFIHEAGHLPITFHRAFDQVRDQANALAILQQFSQVRSILTSGGKSSALDAIAPLQRLQQSCRGTSLQIMAGGGLTIEQLPNFLEETGVQAVHFGSGVRHGSSFEHPIDESLVRKAKQMISSHLHDQSNEQG